MGPEKCNTIMGLGRWESRTGNHNRYLLPWRANNSNCATPRGTMSSMDISYIRISGYQAKTYQVTKSTLFTRLHYEKKKQPTPALLRSHFSTLTHSPCLPTSSHSHLLTPIHPPYAPKLSPISLLPTPPHSPPLPPPHTLTFSSTLILELSCSPEVF